MSTRLYTGITRKTTLQTINESWVGHNSMPHSVEALVVPCLCLGPVSRRSIIGWRPPFGTGQLLLYFTGAPTCLKSRGSLSSLRSCGNGEMKASCRRAISHLYSLASRDPSTTTVTQSFSTFCAKESSAQWDASFNSFRDWLSSRRAALATNYRQPTHAIIRMPLEGTEGGARKETWITPAGLAVGPV